MAGKTELSFNPDHSLTMFWVTWLALGEAIAEIAEMTKDPERLQQLRARMLALPLGELTEVEEGAGVMHPALSRHLKNFEPEAIQSGIDAVDAALARIKFG